MSQAMTTYRIPDYATESPTGVIVSSVRIESNGHHDRVTIWNRGGNAGTLTVKAGDGKMIARWLMPERIVENG